MKPIRSLGMFGNPVGVRINGHDGVTGQEIVNFTDITAYLEGITSHTLHTHTPQGYNKPVVSLKALDEIEIKFLGKTAKGEINPDDRELVIAHLPLRNALSDTLEGVLKIHHDYLDWKDGQGQPVTFAEATAFQGHVNTLFEIARPERREIIKNELALAVSSIHTPEHPKQGQWGLDHRAATPATGAPVKTL